jgi:hypothetical protein
MIGGFNENTHRITFLTMLFFKKALWFVKACTEFSGTTSDNDLLGDKFDFFGFFC